MAHAFKLQVQRLCENLILGDPAYLYNLRSRLRQGMLAPAMEAVIWYYAFGKPIEKVEVEERRAITIIHEFIKAPTESVKRVERVGSGDRHAADGDDPLEPGPGTLPPVH